MCGKYYADREFIPRLSTLFRDNDIMPDEELRKEWETVLMDDDAGSGPEYVKDISPTDCAITVFRDGDGLAASIMKWGFRDPYHNSLIINARSETAAEKGMFSESVRERRCVIPASGYYEWDRAKCRYRFMRPDNGLVLLAGIYRPEQGKPRFTILTTAANECMRPVHDRMPVTIERDEIKAWVSDRDRTRGFLDRSQPELFREQDSGQLTMDLGV